MSAKQEEPAAAAPTEAPTTTVAPDSIPSQPVVAVSKTTDGATTATEDVENKMNKLAVSETAEPATAEKSDVAPPAPVSSAETHEQDAEANKPSNNTPHWPETSADHPLTKLYELLPSLLKEADYNEVYGITLSDTKDDEFLTKLILQKFLRANQNDLPKAKDQLLDTLKWRKEFNPIAAAKASYPRQHFDQLGQIIEIEGVPDSPNKNDVVTFNVYGAVKSNKDTFGDLDTFLRWRVGLMERSIQKLNLQRAAEPIPDFGKGRDPYQGIQVHDYMGTSFFSFDKDQKNGSRQTINLLARHYPETMSRKFFVNVPVMMGWMYNVMKRFVAAETVKKFVVMNNGKDLAAELGPRTPKEYGGQTDARALKEMSEQLGLVDWEKGSKTPAQRWEDEKKSQVKKTTESEVEKDDEKKDANEDVKAEANKENVKDEVKDNATEKEVGVVAKPDEPAAGVKA